MSDQAQEHPVPSEDALAQVDALLAGEEPQEEEQEQQEEPVDEHPEKEAAEPEADREEEEPEAGDEEQEPDEEAPAIDYELEIPMPDGRESIKLGELKDKVVALERTESQYIERENALMRQQDELAQAMSMVGEIPPQLKEQMARLQQQHLAREQQAMVAAIPEWQDRTVFDQDRQAIAAVGQQYGFTPEEIGGIMDHRVIKFMRDHSRLLSQQERAQETVTKLHKARKPKGRKPKPVTRKSDLDKQVASAIESGDETVKLDAIDKLLS